MGVPRPSSSRGSKRGEDWTLAEEMRRRGVESPLPSYKSAPEGNQERGERGVARSEGVDGANGTIRKKMLKDLILFREPLTNQELMHLYTDVLLNFGSSPFASAFLPCLSFCPFFRAGERGNACGTL